MKFFWNMIFRKKFIRPLAVITFLVCAAYYYVMVYVGLPSDEEMIAHLKAHRGEIEELIRRYQSFKMPLSATTEEGKYLLPGAYDWKWEKQHPDTEDIMEKAGIRGIAAGGRIWLPDPYSLDSIKKYEEMLRNFNREEYRLYEYSSRVLSIAYSPRNKYNRVNVYYGLLGKGMRYFPQVPKIENGCLIYPGSKYPTVCHRVLTSLDRIPPNWRRFECVYRQIEPQWFLSLCR